MVFKEKKKPIVVTANYWVKESLIGSGYAYSLSFTDHAGKHHSKIASGLMKGKKASEARVNIVGEIISSLKLSDKFIIRLVINTTDKVLSSNINRNITLWSKNDWKLKTGKDPQFVELYKDIHNRIDSMYLQVNTKLIKGVSDVPELVELQYIASVETNSISIQVLRAYNEFLNKDKQLIYS